MRYPISPGLSLWLRLVALFAPARAAVHCLLALCLALGATRADAQIRDTSVDIVLGSGSYTFVLADFPGFTDGGALSFESLPDRGTLLRGDGRSFVGRLGHSNPQGQQFFVDNFASTLGRDRFEYIPPDDAISVAAGFASFRFSNLIITNVTMATMTINLVGASTQTAASGAPRIAATDTHQISASIAGVTEPNGVNVGTLSWQWQQAAAPASGVPAPSAYIVDIEDATSSLFAPTAAQLGRYVCACVSFMDQFSMPASEGPLCSDGRRVTQLPPDIRLRLRIFLEGPLR